MKLLVTIFVTLLFTNPTIALSQHVITNPFFVEKKPAREAKKQPISEADAVRANNAISLLRKLFENDGQNSWEESLDFMVNFKPGDLMTDRDVSNLEAYPQQRFHVRLEVGAV